MSTLSDTAIRDEVEQGNLVVDVKNLDKQMSASGVDLMLGERYMAVEDGKTKVASGKPITFEPGKLYLVETVGKVEIPDDMEATVQGRFSLLEEGLAVGSSGGYYSPGFRGRLVVDVENKTNEDVLVHPGELFCQVRFQRLEGKASEPYGQGDSQYQDQSGIEE